MAISPTKYRQIRKRHAPLAVVRSFVDRLPRGGTWQAAKLYKAFLEATGATHVSRTAFGRAAMATGSLERTDGGPHRIYRKNVSDPQAGSGREGAALPRYHRTPLTFDDGCRELRLFEPCHDYTEDSDFKWYGS
jgi:hypothetical protein